MLNQTSNTRGNLPKSLLLVLLLSSAAMMSNERVFADQVYIRDILYVPLREGQSNEHTILHKGLKSGTILERLETNEETGYTRIRTNNGLEGWLKTQYIAERPIAQVQLETLKTEMKSLNSRYQQTLLELADAKNTEKTMTIEYDSLKDESITVAENLKAITKLSQDAIATEERNKQLHENNDILLREIKALKASTDAASERQAQEWFIRGAGAVLSGLIFGFWVGRRIYNKNHQGGWA
jgi:SH3 domain protein